MRAVKGRHGILSIIGRDEAALFNKADFVGFLDISSLTEREQLIAEDLYKKNVLKKVKRAESIGYKTFQQKEKI